MTASPILGTFTACCGHCGRVASVEAVSVADIPEASATIEADGWIYGPHGIVCLAAGPAATPIAEGMLL